MLTVRAFQVRKAFMVALMALDFGCELAPNGSNGVDVKGV